MTHRLASPLLLLIVLSACGGSPKPAEEAPARGDDTRSPSTSVEPEPETPAGPDCDDGTCFPCGAGVCPKGAYCDATGGGACAWLPECPGEPSCACLTKALGAGCACEATDGGPLVRCE